MYIRVDYEFKTTVCGITGCNVEGSKYYDILCWEGAVKDIQKFLKNNLDITIDVRIVDLTRDDNSRIKARFAKLYSPCQYIAWDERGVRTTTEQNITMKDVRKIIREIATEE